MNTDMNMIKIKLIEKALGYELYDNTKDFLLSGVDRDEIYNFFPKNERQTGKTTAYCIHIALSKGTELNFRTKLIADEFHDFNYYMWFKGYFRDIRNKLKSMGFEVRDCKF